jgi:TonB family protein
VRFTVRIALLLTVVAGSNAAVYAQQTAPAGPHSGMVKGDVALVGLSNPVYPPMARQARISGDVELKVEIRKDGSVESAAVVVGHPLLAQAALNSAKRSQFECRACEDEVTPYSLIYSFEFAASPGWPCSEESGLHVTQSQNRITTVMAEPALLEPYFTYISARSAKCLYLWACGRRWGGEDYYYYRVRSAKCLDLWNCGHHLREPFFTCNKLHRSLSY